MASDGKEEQDFKIKLREEILSIDKLEGWIGPTTVVVTESGADLKDQKFGPALIAITDVASIPELRKFGAIGGQITFECYINVVVRNSEDIEGALPGVLVGTTEGPSIPIIDGALRNGLDMSTLGSWCFDTNIGPGEPILSDEIPNGTFGRRYRFSAIKEVEL